MLFNSYEFLIFFPIVTILYFALPQRMRWAMLLAASCFFYTWFIPYYLGILVFTIIVDYFAGILIENAHGARRKWMLMLSIAANVGVLALFKYYNFLNGNVAALAHAIGWNYPIPTLKIILPIGLSFHTFQAMSYTIEVYFGREKAERHFGIYALYVMFYPQLVAGPIERPQNLLHQFREHHRFDYDRVVSGLRLMAWGMFMKAVVADRLALTVNKIYASPADYSGPALVLGTAFFAFQIFCDFAGYSTIAIGAARVMGFRLMQNFNSPYHSASISEFWRRWHISLSTWFRDYLYIPLGGNRVSVPRLYANLMIVFLVSGLWHGANWTYVIWGGLHGVYLVFGLMTAGARKWLADRTGLSRVPFIQRPFQVLFVFALVCIGWIFFRASSPQQAWYILSHLHVGWSTQQDVLLSRLAGLQRWDLLFGLAGIFVILCVDLVRSMVPLNLFVARRPWWMRWPAYVTVILLILNFGVIERVAFIYFQF